MDKTKVDFRAMGGASSSASPDDMVRMGKVSLLHGAARIAGAASSAAAAGGGRRPGEDVAAAAATATTTTTASAPPSSAAHVSAIDGPCPVYGDAPHEMTSSRLLARFLSRFRLYYPRRRGEGGGGGEGVPDLDVAWAHYEHWTLARYYTDVRDGEAGMVRAEPGERDRPTALYPVWGTPLRELMDFGVSVRMYFSTLLALSAFLLLAGALNVPLFGYFWTYSTNDDVENAIRGSAMCDDAEWSYCPTCAYHPDDYPPYRLDDRGYALRNVCDFDDWLIPGLFSYAGTVVLLVTFGVWFYLWQRRAEVVFDEDIQTASDYSVKVTNPPGDATDPEEWREFMERFAAREDEGGAGAGAGSGGGVRMCTVALDNSELIGALVERRKLLRKLADVLPPGTDMSDRSAIERAVEESSALGGGRFRLPCLPDAAGRYDRVRSVEDKVRDLIARREYRAVAVFVTFETERGQRNALHTLSTGRINIWRNRADASHVEGGSVITVREETRKDGVGGGAESSGGGGRSSTHNVLHPILGEDERVEHRIKLVRTVDSCDDVTKYLLFRGDRVLHVKEAVEPNDVRWEDLQVPGWVRLVQYVGTTVALLAFIGWSGYFITGLVKNYPRKYSTLFIAATNVIVPKICEKINAFESHSTEGGRQNSLFVKVAIFRWFNSAIVFSLIFDFVETISVEDGNEEGRQSLIYSVAPIIFAELFTVPVMKLLDTNSVVRKHVLAPRARDQDEMNGCFIGGKLELADLYTDATKILFVSLFYSAIFPEALFLGSLALAAHFAAGKICLLRLWRSTPDVGHLLARLSRNYFFSTALVAHVVMSAYWWSGYPYDHVCGDGGSGYYHCSQDMLRMGVFPPLPRFQPDGYEWMTPSQEVLTSLYGWTSVFVVACMALAFLTRVAYPQIATLFRSSYSPDGADQNVSFTDVKHLHEIRGYVPQCSVPGFSHPLIACDLRGIDDDLVGWKDRTRGFECHSLFEDARRILGGGGGGPPLPLGRPAFSVVRHWKP